MFVAVIVAYSPLCRGFLSEVDKMDKLDENDSRRGAPRFTGENYITNKQRVQKFFDIAKEKGCTPSQLALAWVHAQGEDVFPIPGTKSSVRIAENAGAFDVLRSLSAADVQNITDCVPPPEGDRYASSASTFNSRV